jgi:hypothetical protein
MRPGAPRKEAGRAYGLVDIRTPKEGEAVNEAAFSDSLNHDKLREVRRRGGTSLIRTNLACESHGSMAGEEAIWHY